MPAQVIVETQIQLAYGSIKAKQKPVELSVPHRGQTKNSATVFFMIVTISI
jgi:hypothetical protein